MNTTFDDIRFDEAELDRTLDEVNISTRLDIAGQRSMAAYSLLVFSMAISIRDEVQYSSAVSSLRELPDDDDELAFLCDFGRALATDLERELMGVADEAPIFVRRAAEFLSSVSLQFH